MKRVVMLLAKPFIIDSRVMNEASSLSANGYSVQVISWDRDGRQPSDFTYAGARVRSLKLVGGKSFSGAAYFLSAILLQLYAVFWCLRGPRERFVLHANDINTLLGGVLVKLARRESVKLVYDCHELTPSVYAEWFGRLGVGVLMGVVEKRLVRYVDKTITVSPGLKAYIERETGREAVVLYNTPRKSLVPTEEKSEWKRRLGLEGFVVSFVGYIRRDAALGELVEVARELQKRGVEGVTFVVVGSGNDVERIRMASVGVSNFRLLPNVPYPMALGYVRGSDVSFAVYRYSEEKDGSNGARNWLFGGSEALTMHWKISEAMACAACPLLRTGTQEWEFVERIGFGISAGTGSRDEILHAVEWGFSNQSEVRALAKIGHDYYVSKFNWESMSECLIMAYQD